MMRPTLAFVCNVLAISSAFSTASAAMAPMQFVGPQPRPVPAGYAKAIRVAADGADHKSIVAALESVRDASPDRRYAVLVAAGTYHDSRVELKPYVDLYGGFAAGAGGDWKTRDVYQNKTILDGGKKGPIVIGADHARLDGFVVTGGEVRSHGAGILCDGVSPTIVNNLIVANRTLKPEMKEGLGKQIAHEGAAIALLNGSSAYIANNLICDNVTETGAGAGITARGRVNAKILRNVFCNNTAGEKDNAQFHGKEGSRSSPGAAIAVNDESAPQISFNVMVLGRAVYRNDAGGIWVEGNSTPLINYNWIAGNTAYDDGGGIYVMGSLWYDEAGERHDAPPDAPVTIEDNLIAGNDTVYGGPSGVRISRFGRADLRRNRIVANLRGSAHGGEGGVLCVMEDNVIKDNGDPRGRGGDGSPSFAVTGDIAGREFDATHFVTQIATGKPLPEKNELAGSAVRVGRQWSIVKSAGPKGLMVWGRVMDGDAKAFEILDSYLPPDEGFNKKD